MARMSDEAYELMQENREKKVTAHSAKNRRGHTGKGGSVRLPSDNLTKKQREAMNGDCKSYRLGSPMGWEEFNEMPDGLKIMYIKLIRDKYHTPDRILAQCMGVPAATFSKKMRELNIGLVQDAEAEIYKWYGSTQAQEFEAWWYKTKTITKGGSLEVEGNVEGDLKKLIDILKGRNVRLKVEWTELEG